MLKAAGLGLAGGLANVRIAPDGAAAWLHGLRYSLSLLKQEGFSVAVAECIRG